MLNIEVIDFAIFVYDREPNSSVDRGANLTHIESSACLVTGHLFILERRLDFIQGHALSPLSLELCQLGENTFTYRAS